MGTPDRKVLTENELDQMEIAAGGGGVGMLLGCPGHPGDGVTAIYDSGTPALRLLCHTCGVEVAVVKVGTA